MTAQTVVLISNGDVLRTYVPMQEGRILRVSEDRWNSIIWPAGFNVFR
jgi:hypothetical protein